MTRSELLDLIHDRLGVCDCFGDDGAVGFCFDLLEAAEMRDVGMSAEADELLDQMLPEQGLARALPIYWLVGAGLIAHGHRLDDFGLTEFGAEVLEAMRDAGPDSIWDRITPLQVTLGTEPDRSLN